MLRLCYIDVIPIYGLQLIKTQNSVSQKVKMLKKTQKQLWECHDLQQKTAIKDHYSWLLREPYKSKGKFNRRKRKKGLNFLFKSLKMFPPAGFCTNCPALLIDTLDFGIFLHL